MSRPGLLYSELRITTVPRAVSPSIQISVAISLASVPYLPVVSSSQYPQVGNRLGGNTVLAIKHPAARTQLLNGRLAPTNGFFLLSRRERFESVG